MGSGHSRSGTESVFLEIRFGILNRDYLPGQVLDRQLVSETFDCSQSAVLDAFTTLVVEGYLEMPRRGAFSVRRWSIIEVEDLFDIGASVSGFAAAKAAERASDVEIANIARMASSWHGHAEGPADEVERFILDRVEFHCEVLRLAKVGSISDMVKFVVPNMLFRKVVWGSTISDLREGQRLAEKVVGALTSRSAAFAGQLMREMILSARQMVIDGLIDDTPKVAVEYPKIVRFVGPVMVNGILFGLGGREPAADGKIIPFGVNPGR